jgi:hypothetical protein
MKANKQVMPEEQITLEIPKVLYERVATYCKTKGITPLEFIIEAISEKLASIHKEKRKKQRL